MITHTQVSKLGDTALQIRAWKDVTIKDSALQALDMTGLKDATIQIDGKFGNSQVSILGSNDGMHYHLLRDRDGLPLRFKKEGIFFIDANSWHIIPLVVDPDEETKLNLTVCARRYS